MSCSQSPNWRDPHTGRPEISNSIAPALIPPPIGPVARPVPPRAPSLHFLLVAPTAPSLTWGSWGSWGKLPQVKLGAVGATNKKCKLVALGGTGLATRPIGDGMSAGAIDFKISGVPVCGIGL